MEAKELKTENQQFFNIFVYNEERYKERNFRVQTIRKEIFNRESPPFTLFITGATKQTLRASGALTRKIHETDGKETTVISSQWINIPHTKTKIPVEELYKKLCRRQEEGHTVHWLYLHDGELVWKECHGDISKIIKYVDIRTSVINTAITESQILESKYLIIADDRGAGKSSLLTTLAKKLERISSKREVHRFDLRNFIKGEEEAFRLKDIVLKDNEAEEALECVAKMINHKKPLEKIEFKHKCRDTSDVILVFDGFDEINKEDQKKTLKLLRALKTGSGVRLWATTRPSEKTELEKALGTIAYRLEPLTRKQQIAILDKLWKQKLHLLLSPGQGDSSERIREYLKQARQEFETIFKGIEEPKHRVKFLMLLNSVSQIVSISIRAHIDGKDDSSMVLEKVDALDFSSYIKYLLRGVNAANQRGKVAFSSIPLNLVLTGVIIFEDRFRMLDDLNIYDLCERFVEMKFAEYYTRKKRSPSSGNIYATPEFFSCKQMTLDSLLSEDVTSSPHTFSEKFDQELIEEIGLVEKTRNGFRFIHHSLEEYFFCEWVVSDLSNEEVQKILVKKILREPNYSAVRRFLDLQIEKKVVRINLMENVIKDTDFFGYDERKGTFLHLLSYEGLSSILEMFLQAFPEEIAKIALKTNKKSQNFLHLSCSESWNAVVKIILKFAKFHLQKEVVEKLFLQKDQWGISPFYDVGGKDFVDLFVDFLHNNNGKISEEVSSYLLEINLLSGERDFLSGEFIKNRPESFSKMLEVAFSQFSPDKYRTLVIQQTDMDGNTCLHKLACFGSVDNLLQFWEFADKSMSVDSLEEYLKQINGRGNTVFHQSALGSNTFTLRQFVRFSKLLMVDFASVSKFLLTVNGKGCTIVHEAIVQSNVEFLRQLVDLLDEELDRETLKHLLCLRNGALDTVLHLAVRRDEIEVMRLVCGYLREVLKKESQKEILLARNVMGFTAFHCAADKGCVDIIRLLCEFAESLDFESLRDCIKSTANNGDTVFHLAATRGKSDVLRSFVEYSLGFLSKESMKAVLNRGNEFGHTTLHMTALNSLADTADYWFRFTSFAVEIESLKDALMKTNVEGDSVLHLAAKKGKLPVLLHICSHVKSKLDKGFYIQFLSSSDGTGNTILHIAVLRGELEFMTQLFEFIKEEVDRDQLKSILKHFNNNGDTLFHCGVRGGRKEILRQLFEFVSDVLSESVIRDIVVRPNAMAKTALQMAYDAGNFDIMRELCNGAKASFSDDSLLEFMTNINDFGETFLHLAVHLDETSKMAQWCSYARELLNKEYLGQLFAVSNQQGDTVLHYVLRLRDSDVIDQWFQFAKKALDGEQLRNILEKTNGSGDTIMHLASSVGDIEVTKRLCEFSRAVQGKESLTETLLKCNKNGDPVLHSVVRRCEVVAIKFWLDFMKDELGEEFLAKSLPQINTFSESVLHLSVVRDDVEILKMLCDYANGVLSKSSMESFMTARIKNGSNALHFIVTKGDIMMMDTFWKYCVDCMGKEVLENFLAQTNGADENILHLATNRGKLSILIQAFNYLKECVSQESMKTIMTKRNFDGNGILHIAVMKGRLDIVGKLSEWTSELLGEDYSELFLTNPNSKGDTILHLAVYKCEATFLGLLCDFCKEKLSQESLTTLVMLPNKEGSTCLLSATVEGETVIVNKIYEFAKSVLDGNNLEIFFKKSNNDKDTVLHIGVRDGKQPITMYLCEYAKEFMSAESIKRFLNRPNSKGKTVLDEAVLSGKNYYIESLWEYANQVPEQISPQKEYRMQKAARNMDCCYTS